MAWALFCHDFDLSKGINILSEKCPVVLDHYILCLRLPISVNYFAATVAFPVQTSLFDLQSFNFLFHKVLELFTNNNIATLLCKR